MEESPILISILSPKSENTILFESGTCENAGIRINQKQFRQKNFFTTFLYRLYTLMHEKVKWFIMDQLFIQIVFGNNNDSSLKSILASNPHQIRNQPVVFVHARTFPSFESFRVGIPTPPGIPKQLLYEFQSVQEY